MNELEVFKNSEFGSVRVIKDDRGEPWFIAKDVADILGYSETNDMTKYLDKDEKKTIKNFDPDKLSVSNKVRQITIIDESGLYNAIFRSKLPTAKQFRKWVTSEVLPAIRKHGGYLTETKTEELLSNPDLLIELATALKKEREEKAKLESKLIEVKPKVEYVEAIIESENSIDLGLYAKIISKRLGIKIGRNTLFKLLKDNKVLMKDNVPYQSYMSKGYFEVKEITYYKGTTPCVGTKTLVTGLGQERLFHILKEIINNIKEQNN